VSSPLRRLVAPQEVASAVLFLASSLASGITGHTLVVDAGVTLAGYAHAAAHSVRDVNGQLPAQAEPSQPNAIAEQNRFRARVIAT